MSEWKEYSLNDVYSISSGLSKPAEDFGSGFPFLSFKEVFNNFFIPEKLSELVESTEKERLQCSILRGDVFLTRTSETVKELGMSCVALKDYENATFNGFTKRLRPKENVEIIPEYAGYYFRNSKFRKEVTAMSSASTRASLNIEMIGRLKIILPSKVEQSSIAFILKNLDDKIENLRRQNETLEQIAQTLFKHWFIDFEFPNADGKPYKSSGGAMSPSELGDIPEGWRVGQICDLVNHVKDSLNPSKSPNTFFLHYSLPAFDVNKEPIKELGTDIKSNKYQVYSNVILVSKLNPHTPRIWEILDLTYDFCICSTEFQILKPKKKIYFEYCIQILNLRKNIISLGTMASGTSGSHRRVKPSDILDIDCIIPDENSFVQVNKVLEPLLKKQHQNKKQIKTLTKTRDALLPKLMSGQLRVKE